MRPSKHRWSSSVSMGSREKKRVFLVTALNANFVGLRHTSQRWMAMRWGARWYQAPMFVQIVRGGVFLAVLGLTFHLQGLSRPITNGAHNRCRVTWK